MPDEDEIEHDRVEDVLLVEALMGWDGDRCECDECDCPRFRDAADDVRCGDCREGRHWTGTGGWAGWDDRYHAGIYGIPDESTLSAMRLAARLEAMITDPVYEGTSMAG